MHAISLQPFRIAPDLTARTLGPSASRIDVAPTSAANRLLNRPIVGDRGELIGLMNIEEHGQLLVGRWVGHCTPDAVVKGMRVAHEMLTLQPCPAILSDGSAAVGDWSDLIPWMQYDMLPRLVETGVRFIANVRSPDPASRIAHQNYAQFASRYLTIRLFDEPGQAREWLHQLLATARIAGTVKSPVRISD